MSDQVKGMQCTAGDSGPTGLWRQSIARGCRSCIPQLCETSL
jgi:hypothetical protein